jgi:hypothetical protein
MNKDIPVIDEQFATNDPQRSLSIRVKDEVNVSIGES